MALTGYQRHNPKYCSRGQQRFLAHNRHQTPRRPIEVVLLWLLSVICRLAELLEIFTKKISFASPHWIAVCISSLDSPWLKFSKYHLGMQMQERQSDTLCLLSGAGKVWKRQVSSTNFPTIRAIYQNCGLVSWLVTVRDAQFQRGRTKQYILPLNMTQGTNKSKATKRKACVSTCPLWAGEVI